MAAVRFADPARRREAAMLQAGELAAMWDAFACPYLAFAAGHDEVALLMDDLSPHLFPDVREPLADEAEERLVGYSTATPRSPTSRCSPMAAWRHSTGRSSAPGRR